MNAAKKESSIMNFMYKLAEPKTDIDGSKKFISNKAIVAMTVPLLIEQFLQLVVGIADTMVSSYAGQDTIAGVSLVTTIYSVFIFLFTGLSLGGSVAISQSMGRKDFDQATNRASQTALISFLFSMICMILMLVFGDQMLVLLYGRSSEAVVSNAQIYLRIVSLSFPANAVYNACAGMQKCLARTKITMGISFIINGINIIGDYVGVIILHKGAAGVAWPTTISWFIAAIVIIIISFDTKQDVFICGKYLRKLDHDCVKEVMYVAVPNTVENGLFQVAKVVLASVIATFGVEQIAANGIGQTIWNMTAIFGIAASPVFVTIIGQAKGADDREAARYYWIKLTNLVTMMSFCWNVLMTVLLPIFLLLYNASAEVRRYVIITTILHNFFTGTISPLALTSPSGFKAAGDVKYPLYTALLCTCVIRVALTFLFGVYMNLGIVGYMCAMCCDWSVKALLVYIRFKSGKWYKD